MELCGMPEPLHGPRNWHPCPAGIFPRSLSLLPSCIRLSVYGAHHLDELGSCAGDTASSLTTTLRAQSSWQTASSVP